MNLADVRAAGDAFSIDSTMNEAAIKAEVSQLATVVRQAADSYSAQVTSGGRDDDAQTNADLLEDIVGELDNIDVELDYECPMCEGEAPHNCVECGGTGEAKEPTITGKSILEARAAVAAAMSALPKA